MKQSEIWLVNLEPTVGAEIKKTRPAVIVSNDVMGRLPLKVIVPLTDWKEHYSSFPWMVKLMPDDANGLTKPSAADCFQVRSLSDERLSRVLGQLDAQTMQSIKKALSLVLTIA